MHSIVINFFWNHIWSFGLPSIQHKKKKKKKKSVFKWYIVVCEIQIDGTELSGNTWWGHTPTLSSVFWHLYACAVCPLHVSIHLYYYFFLSLRSCIFHICMCTYIEHLSIDSNRQLLQYWRSVTVDTPYSSHTYKVHLLEPLFL